MQRGFPIALLKLVRCPADEGELRSLAGAAESHIAEGRVRCEGCSAEYFVRSGILSLVRNEALHPESAQEMQLRDEKNDTILAGTPEWNSSFADASELRPTLATVGDTRHMVVLELGSGTGRYSLALAQNAASLMAVDFSASGLQVLRQKLDPDAPVALVQADVTEPYAAPHAFDRALSTLHSNLPSRDHRMASLRNVARAMKDEGRAVISMHHYGLRNVMFGIPASGRYPDSGIFRYHMQKPEARREIDPFFASLRFVHIAASIPGLTTAVVARAAARIPLVRSGFGRLFLAVCEQPRREPRLDEMPAAARFFGRVTQSRHIRE